MLLSDDECGDALEDRNGDTSDGARFGSKALGTSGGSVPPLVDVTDVSDPLATADGALGEPVSSAR